MNHLVRAYVANHCTPAPGGCYELKEFCARFRDTRPDDENWTRSRIVQALAQSGHTIGMRYGIAMIPGIVPRGRYHLADSGKLELVING